MKTIIPIYRVMFLLIIVKILFLFSRLLEKLLDANSGILRSDANVVFNYVANNPVGNEIALDFLINRWNDIQNAYDF